MGEFPLLKRELVGLLRTRRAFWLAGFLVTFSTLLPLLQWPSGVRVAAQAHRNLEVFAIFALTQLTAALVIIPAFTAGAIAGERERGTYELLYSSLVSPSSIVFSKILASTAYVLILLAATSPPLSVLYLLGGIDAGAVLKTYAATFMAVVVSGLVCLTVSLRSRRTAPATVRGMVWVIAWNFGFQMLLVLGVMGLGLGPPVLGPVFSDLTSGLSPYGAIVNSIKPPAGLTSMHDLPFLAYLAFATLVGGGHLAYLLRNVATPEQALGRRPARSLARRERPPAARGRPSRLAGFLLRYGARAPLLGNPVFRKEIACEFFGRSWYRRLFFWGALGGSILILTQFATAMESLRLIGLLSLGLLVLLIPGIAAGSVTREIEQGNLDLLRGTTLSSLEVVQGKLAAAVYGGLGPVAASACVLWISCSLTIWLVQLAIILATLAFTAAFSLFVSVLSRRTLAALVKAYFGLLLLMLGLPLCLSIEGPGGLPACLNPFLIYDRFSSWEVLWQVDPWVGDNPSAFLDFLWIYGAATSGLSWLSASLYERLRMRDR